MRAAAALKTPTKMGITPKVSTSLFLFLSQVDMPVIVGEWSLATNHCAGFKLGSILIRAYAPQNTVGDFVQCASDWLYIDIYI